MNNNNSDFDFNISLDMVRLKTKVLLSDLEYFVQHNFDNSPYVSDYNGFRQSDYRYNFVINEFNSRGNPFSPQDDANNFWVGFCHNSEHNPYNTYLVIEYNPNKCDVTFGLLNKLLRLFFCRFNDVFIRSLDIAFDFKGIPPDNCIIDKGLKQIYKDFLIGGSRTRYIGASGSHCFVKIYDKAREQKLPETVQWTRFEVTLKFEDFKIIQALLGAFDFDFNIPTCFFYKDLDFNGFDTKMKCYLYSIANDFVRLNDFGKDIRKKIRDTLNEVPQIIKIDNDKKFDVYNTIITYFTEFASYFDEEYKEKYKKIVEDIVAKRKLLHPQPQKGEQLGFKDLYKQS